MAVQEPNYQAAVKLHGVFPSSLRVNLISAGTKIHRSAGRDRPKSFTFSWRGSELNLTGIRYLRTRYSYGRRSLWIRVLLHLARVDSLALKPSTPGKVSNPLYSPCASQGAVF